MVVNETFTQGAGPIASYDWVDLQGGVGYTTYYAGASTASGAAVEYFLTTKQLEGRPIYTVLTGTQTQDKDFDIEFQTPVVVKGDALINFTQFGGTASSIVTTINVYHVDTASAETLLGTAIATVRAGDVTTPFRETLKIALTQKHVARGEKLRVNMSAYHAGGNVGRVWHDPASALTATDDLGRTVGTDFICQIPFRLNL